MSAAVVGAGVIGTSIALKLQQQGTAVTLVDRGEAGRGCSFGNAGVIATSFVLPLSAPGTILRVPKMLADPLGPLAIRPADLPSTLPWILRFLAAARPSAQRRSMAGLKTLCAHALPAWRDFLAGAPERKLLIERGMIDVVRDRRALARLRSSARRLALERIAIRELGPVQVAELEPALLGRTAGGVFHEGVAHVDDPFALTEGLLERFRAAGGEFQQVEIRSILPKENGPALLTPAGESRFDRIVVAAGWESATLLERFAKIPIGIEYGYHLMLPDAGIELGRPVSFHHESFLATPMAGGLRLAGTVELASPHSAANFKRADNLLEAARRYWPELRGTGASRWRGARPSVPDSLPAIGQLKDCPEILYAFGHQHLGLTLAAITAQCIDAIVRRAAPPIEVEPFSLARFGRVRRS
jgi:D-amino-acid dehydrogenase